MKISADISTPQCRGKKSSQNSEWADDVKQRESKSVVFGDTSTADCTSVKILTISS